MVKESFFYEDGFGCFFGSSGGGFRLFCRIVIVVGSSLFCIFGRFLCF